MQNSLPERMSGRGARRASWGEGRGGGDVKGGEGGEGGGHLRSFCGE